MGDERTSRVRDNKRRHRARRKEYVLDLERRLAQTREQEVQATKEVQLAAQRVARENAKLRELLRKTGFTDEAINTWVTDDQYLDGIEPSQHILRPMPSQNVENVASTGPPQSGRKAEARNVSVSCSLAPLGSVTAGETCSIQTSASGERSLKISPDPMEPSDGKSELSPSKKCVGTCIKTSSVSGSPNTTRAPCKLLTLLAENPAADITQVPLPSPLEKQLLHTRDSNVDSSDGVECSTAYKMLMQYATSEEKMDQIAVTLERGCTPSAAGGCQVKNSIVWQMLDEECV
ncbi:MAG: hypothetical protein Q9163_000303 [Psora crenata]